MFEQHFITSTPLLNCWKICSVNDNRFYNAYTSTLRNLWFSLFITVPLRYLKKVIDLDIPSWIWHLHQRYCFEGQCLHLWSSFCLSYQNDEAVPFPWKLCCESADHQSIEEVTVQYYCKFHFKESKDLCLSVDFLLK